MILLLAEGNVDAPKKFLEVYVKYIRGVLRRRFSPSDDLLDDLTQTVVMHLFNNNWRVLQQWNRVSRFETYLATVTINRALSYFRANNNALVDDVNDYHDIDDGGDMPEFVETMNMINYLMRRLSEKYPDCRKILLLKYCHDLSYAEIAEVMEKTINQVGVYLNRCLYRCKALIGDNNQLHNY